MNQLLAERDAIENQLRAHVRHLERQAVVRDAKLVAARQRETELLGQLSVMLDDQMYQLVARMKSDHEALLHS